MWIPARPVILAALAVLACIGLAFLFGAVPPGLHSGVVRLDPVSDDA